jgi:hemerythrin-like metal-binding protein
MSLIDWRDEFKLGIPSVDQEHEELIGLINELHQGHLDNESRVTVQKFLGELYARIALHFALEEKIMSTRGYDQYRQHKNDHERLLDEIIEFLDAYENDKSFDDNEFGNFLESWFVDHFKKQDARLHQRLG